MARCYVRIGDTAKTLWFTAAFSALVALTGCGGSSADSSAPSADTTTTTTTTTTTVTTTPAIQGVATPDSVSVVTATNAG